MPCKRLCHYRQSRFRSSCGDGCLKEVIIFAAIIVYQMVVHIPVGSCLAPFVQVAAFFSLTSAAPANRLIVPDGRPTLLINLSDCNGSIGGHSFPMRQFTMLVMGAHTLPVPYQLGSPARFVYIRFHPFGFNSLLGLHGSELIDKVVDVADFHRESYNSLLRRLRAETTEADRISRVMEWLEQRALKAHVPHDTVLHACSLIQRTSGLKPIGELCGSYNTYKQLQRKFEHHVGLNAKLYARMVRFEAMMEAIRQQPQVDWFDLIARFNFHDQSHLIKEFKQFAGETPTSFLESGIEKFV